jgi:hypothetical protein
VAGPKPGGQDQGGEETNGLCGLVLAEGDEVRLCQFDSLVHTITGRLSITSLRVDPPTSRGSEFLR